MCKGLMRILKFQEVTVKKLLPVASLALIVASAAVAAEPAGKNASHYSHRVISQQGQGWGQNSALATAGQTPATRAMASPVASPKAKKPLFTRHYDEGQTIEVQGNLYATRNRRIVLKTLEGEYFILQENQNLARIEKLVKEGRREFRVRGHVSRYGGRNFLSVARVKDNQRIGASGTSSSEGDSKLEKVFKKLMFWRKDS